MKSRCALLQLDSWIDCVNLGVDTGCSAESGAIAALYALNLQIRHNDRHAEAVQALSKRTCSYEGHMAL